MERKGGGGEGNELETTGKRMREGKNSARFQTHE